MNILTKSIIALAITSTVSASAFADSVTEQHLQTQLDQQHSDVV